MEILPIDSLRVILLRLPLIGIVMELSIVSKRVNSLVYLGMKSAIWWEEKLYLDYERHIEQWPERLDAKEAYLFFSLSLGSLAWYAKHRSPNLIDFIKEDVVFNHESYPNIRDIIKLTRHGQFDILRIIFHEPNRANTKVGTTLIALLDKKQPNRHTNVDVVLAILREINTSQSDLYKVLFKILEDKEEGTNQIAIALIGILSPNLSISNYQVLRAAVDAENFEAVKAIVSFMKEDSSGRKIGVDSQHGYALYTAVGNENIDIVRFLLESGANPHSHSDQATSNAIWGKRRNIATSSYKDNTSYLGSRESTKRNVENDPSHTRANILRLLVSSPRFKRAVVRSIPNPGIFKKREDKEYFISLLREGKIVAKDNILGRLQDPS